MIILQIDIMDGNRPFKSALAQLAGEGRINLTRSERDVLDAPLRIVFFPDKVFQKDRSQVRSCEVEVKRPGQTSFHGGVADVKSNCQIFHGKVFHDLVEDPDGTTKKICAGMVLVNTLKSHFAK